MKKREDKHLWLDNLKEGDFVILATESRGNILYSRKKVLKVFDKHVKIEGFEFKFRKFDGSATAVKDKRIIECTEERLAGVLMIQEKQKFAGELARFPWSSLDVLFIRDIHRQVAEHIEGINAAKAQKELVESHKKLN